MEYGPIDEPNVDAAVDANVDVLKPTDTVVASTAAYDAY